ncbi:hypothetical protein CMI37_30185 [Candidatus Pacearchaeota archaeon]|nr:hypothetical protein [Candidatus Pacearchaeota archaeon]
MTPVRIGEKIANLLRLAKSDNVNEAAMAAARAQRLMDKYKIEVALESLADDDFPDEDIINCQDPIERLNQRCMWKTLLADSIGTANQCNVYTQGGDIKIVGRPTDINVVRYLYAYLVREVNRLCDRDCKGCGRTFRNNFRLGAHSALKKKLSQQKEDTIADARQRATGVPDSRALVRVDQALAKIEQRKKDVETWMKKNMRMGTASASRSNYNRDAYEAGQRAGGSIQITRARGSLGSGKQEN